MFNVRVKRFLDTEQVQIFSQPLYSKGEREVKKKCIFKTGEIIPPNAHKFDNPFTGEIDWCYNWGNEEENLQRSTRRAKNLIYDIARSNKWEWFFTLTFNPDVVNSFDYSEVTKKLSKWLNNMKRCCPEMKYIVVPELHKSGRWHFHGLFANVGTMRFVDSGKKDNKGRVIYNVGSYRLGFSTATQIDDLHKACTYIVKYVSKESCD